MKKLLKFIEKVDYKRELESAAKGMIMVHEPELLIKLIVRMLVQKVRISHAGILLHARDKNTYILTVSRGPRGIKIPAGFARMDYDNSLIRFFRERYDKRVLNDSSLIYEKGKKILKSKKIKPEDKHVLREALKQMELFDTIVCIPSYYGIDLLGLLLLGRKNNGRKFSKEEINFFIALASDVAMAIRNAQLFTDLESELHKKHRLFIETTVALAAAIDAKDHYTHGHTARVTFLSLELAKRMARRDKKLFNEKFLENLHIASLLHDIGKIGVPESILNKAGPLSDEERKIMQSHPLVGATILQPINELIDAEDGVKYHHERYDGSGYPKGLKGEEIPLIASIIAVADAFDAMTTDRPYRKGLAKKEATEEIAGFMGRQFHPEVAEALIELYQEGKI